MTLACFGMNLTFEEALVARDDQRRLLARSPGSHRQPRAGKQMDAVVVHGPAINLIRVGADTIRAVVKRGRLVVGN